MLLAGRPPLLPICLRFVVCCVCCCVVFYSIGQHALPFVSGSCVFVGMRMLFSIGFAVTRPFVAICVFRCFVFVCFVFYATCIVL